MLGLQAFPWKLLKNLQVSFYPGLDSNLRPSAELLRFAPISSRRQGSWQRSSSVVGHMAPVVPWPVSPGGGGTRSQVQPLRIGGERGARKVSFLGKRVGNAAPGKKIKQSSFSSLLARRGCGMSR